MQYGLAFGYAVNRPGGFTNLLMLVVCGFIPVVGPIVALGYRAEVAVRLIHDPDLRRHPRFDFNRFGDYLSRGIWPFLVGLILGVSALVPMLLSFAVGAALAAAVDPVAGIVVGGVLYVLSFVALVMLSAPMTLHAELTGRFDLGGGYRFAVQFWKTVGAQAILAIIVFVPLAIGITLVGLLCCFVGVYFTSVVCQMAAHHLLVQLYCEYLDRGGDALPEFDPEERRVRRRSDYDDEEYEDDVYDDRR